MAPLLTCRTHAINVLTCNQPKNMFQCWFSLLCTKKSLYRWQTESQAFRQQQWQCGELVSDQTNKAWFSHIFPICQSTLKERSSIANLGYLTSKFWCWALRDDCGNLVNSVRLNKQAHYIRITVNEFSRWDFPKPISDISPAICDVRLWGGDSGKVVNSVRSNKQTIGKLKVE